MQDLLIDTSSEQYRHECEVRHVANLPKAELIRDYLEGVRNKRGDSAAERLRDDVVVLYTAKKKGSA